MSGLVILPKNLARRDVAETDVRDIICPTPDFEMTSLSSGEYRLFESHRARTPFEGPRAVSTGRFSIILSGDVVRQRSSLLQSILDEFLRRNDSFFEKLDGIFSIAIHDRIDHKLHVISDRRSQKPIFVGTGSAGPIISTNIAVFLRIYQKAEFNEQWLWQYLSFNFPVDTATFLKGVNRVEAASILTYDEATELWTQRTYATPFGPRFPLRSGKDELYRALSVFEEVATSYYSDGCRSACALTGGWDGRSLLAMAPKETDVQAYTYGCPGCDDIVSAESTALRAGIPHHAIPFDSTFVESIPHYALETVYLSGGLQGVLRSTLLYVYETLTANGRQFPLTISGISLGTQLRGAAQFPDLVSHSIAKRLTGESSADLLEHGVLENGSGEANQFLQSKVDELDARFGSAVDSTHHLLYVVYPASAHYFCGELAVADAYTTVRVPAWDSRVIELNFSSVFSTLALSRFSESKQGTARTPLILQAFLLKHFSESIYRMPVRGIHPSFVLGGEALYQLERVYRLLERTIKNRTGSQRKQPLENWNSWIFESHNSFVSNLLRSSDTKVVDWIASKHVNQAIAKRDLRFVGKLLTVEVILRLVERRWTRFW